jgi:hypothetical protein
MDVDIDRQLDAQRRVVEAEIRYYQAKAEYAVALKNVQLSKNGIKRNSSDGRHGIVVVFVSSTLSSICLD